MICVVLPEVNFVKMPLTFGIHDKTGIKPMHFYHC
jgi:hypothetical protein